MIGRFNPILIIDGCINIITLTIIQTRQSGYVIEGMLHFDSCQIGCLIQQYRMTIAGKGKPEVEVVYLTD